jgi:hypothetical protein
MVNTRKPLVKQKLTNLAAGILRVVYRFQKPEQLNLRFDGEFVATEIAFAPSPPAMLVFAHMPQNLSAVRGE